MSNYMGDQADLEATFGERPQRITTWAQAWKTIEQDVADARADGRDSGEQAYREFAQILLDVEDVAPAVAKRVRRHYGLAEEQPLRSPRAGLPVVCENKMGKPRT